MPNNVKPIPEGHRTVALYLAIKNAASALEFYRNAFGAVETFKLLVPDGRVAPESLGGSPVSIHLDVEDVDALVKRAVAAGARETKPVTNQFYGDVSSALESAPAILVRSGNVSITDGPFAETKEQASGAASPSR